MMKIAHHNRETYKIIRDITSGLPDQELLSRAYICAKTEKEAVLELLDYLVEIDQRKLYATKQYSTLAEFLIKEHHLSEGQAYERANVVRLMRAVSPVSENVVKEKIAQGVLSISTASQIQRFFNLEKKYGDRQITTDEKVEILESISGKSKREVQKVIFSLQSENVRVVSQEKTKMVSETHTELKFQVQEETIQKLNEVKNLLGNESLARIFDEALSELLQKLKKKQGHANLVKIKKESADAQPESEKSTLPEKAHSRFISIHAKRVVLARSKGQCEHVSIDQTSSESSQKIVKRCESRYRLQFDHIEPFSRGGSSEASNLRHLCAQHNQRAAIEMGLAWQKCG